MAGSIINQNGSSSITVTNLIEILEGERVGFNAVSLTNMSTTSVSAIAAGSHCEIGGSLYQFSTEEPISTSNITSTSAMTYYVELVPSSSEVTAQFSSVVPEWRDDYQGWYESTSLNYRVVARNYFNGSDYSTEYKHYLDEPARKNYVQDIYVSSKITCDDLYCDDIDASGSIDADGNITNNGYLKSDVGRRTAGTIDGDNVTENTIFDALSPCIVVDEEMIISGGWSVSGEIYIAVRAIRHSSTIIYLLAIRVSDGSRFVRVVDNGSTSTLDTVSISY